MIAQGEVRSAATSASQEACLSLSACGHAQASDRQVSLVEVLDRVLNKGAVLTGGITISVANIPLIYVGLNLLIASVETLERHLTKPFPSPLPSP